MTIAHGSHHLAQLNIARMKAPVDGPLMQRFVEQLEPINALADRSPGFVWRLQSEEGDATSIRAFDDELMLVNMSVWESLEALKAYVFDSDHVQVMRDRAQWFERMETPQTVLWWIPQGHTPTIEEGKERLHLLLDNGPSEDAFTFRRPFAFRAPGRPGVNSDSGTAPSTWQPQFVSSFESPEAKVREASFAEAQPWCNFVVLQPASLPSGMLVEECTLRPEAPPGRSDNLSPETRPDWHSHNRSCFRCEVVSPRGRLRLKQFLYDWAPPACDHPSLWQSRPKPFVVGRNIGWIGTDFKSARAACISVDRTMVELSLLDGEFSDDELQAICRSLTPVDETIRRSILATPFVELCYQYRHAEQTHRLPCGLFAHRRDEQTQLRVAAGHDAPTGLPGRPLLPESIHGYELDSVFWFEDEKARTVEAEYLYERQDPPGSYLRILVSDRNGKLRFPPTLDEHPAAKREHGIAGGTVHHAFVTAKYGPHEAVWERSGLTFSMLTKPRPDSDVEWFLELLAAFTE